LTLIEINWGKPLSFVVSPAGDIQDITTARRAFISAAKSAGFVPARRIAASVAASKTANRAAGFAMATG